jgi:hypothetical protein
LCIGALIRTGMLLCDWEVCELFVVVVVVWRKA